MDCFGEGGFLQRALFICSLADDGHLDGAHNCVSRIFMCHSHGSALCADEARAVSGQVFGVRNNEIYLFSQPRPIKTAHRGEGWTPESVLETAIPMMQSDFYPLDRSGDVFTWDPV
jgi:hypothetical protein